MRKSGVCLPESSDTMNGKTFLKKQEDIDFVKVRKKMFEVQLKCSFFIPAHCDVMRCDVKCSLICDVLLM